MKWLPYFSAFFTLQISLFSLELQTTLTPLSIPSAAVEPLFIEEPLFGPLPLFLSDGSSPLDRLTNLPLTQRVISQAPNAMPLEEVQAPALFLEGEDLSYSLQTHLPSRSLPYLHSYALPQKDPALLWGKEFKVSVQVMPDKKANRHLFLLSLQPHDEIEVAPMKQNFHFLIDRSNSIAKQRFTVFKKAVLKTLSHLEEGNSFNIYVFDKKVSRLSEKNLPLSKESIEAAEAFLEKQEAGGFFASGDLFASLEQILPTSVAEDEAHTAILLTNGEIVLKQKKQHKVIKSWMEKNQGKVDLYTAATGINNNFPLLDLLSALNRGTALHSDTHSAFPRKLAKRVMDLQEPLAKDISLAVIPSDPESHIRLYPPQSRLPTLYRNQPYLLVGSIDQLSDFTLLIEGKHQGEEILIEKQISFADAKNGDLILEKKWGAEQAHLLYDLFLEKGDISYFQEAKDLLDSER